MWTFRLFRAGTWFHSPMNQSVGHGLEPQSLEALHNALRLFGTEDLANAELALAMVWLRHFEESWRLLKL
eukprot:Skav205715  [mRNA]  locus=scaffold608:68277:69792:+ [translate_table: standard]